MGVMTVGMHHRAHYLALAAGQNPHAHGVREGHQGFRVRLERMRLRRARHHKRMKCDAQFEIK